MGITNAGLSGARALVAASFTYLELGTGTTAVSATHTALAAAITDSGLARASATVTATTTAVSNDTIQWYKQWTASGSKTLAEIGVFNNSSGGTMLCRSLISPTKAVVSGDTYTATYTVDFS